MCVLIQCVDYIYNIFLFTHIVHVLGWGVFSKTPIEKNAFVVQYRGTLRTSNEMIPLEKKYNKMAAGSFNYYFDHANEKLWYELIQLNPFITIYDHFRQVVIIKKTFV